MTNPPHAAAPPQPPVPAQYAPPPRPQAGPGGPPAGGPAMARLIKAELLKVFTTNTWWIFGIFLVASTGLTLAVNVSIANDAIGHARAAGSPGPSSIGQPPAVRAQIAEAFADLHTVLVRSAGEVFTSGQYLGLLFMVVLGALIVTNEYHHQTATTTFLTTPHRTAVILSKMGAGAVLALMFWGVGTAINLLFGSASLDDGGLGLPLREWPVQRAILFNLLAYVIWAVLGIGLGVLIRSQLGATMTATLAYLLSVPLGGLITLLVYRNMIHEDWVLKATVLIPGIASNVMVTAEPTQIGDGFLQWWVGAVVLICYGVLFGTLGTLITRRRDIS